MTDVLQLAISAWVLFVLARSAQNAWARRDLLTLVWRGVTPRVLAKAFGLLLATLATAAGLLQFVPPMRWGLGLLVSFEGNAVFTPLDRAAQALGPAPVLGPDWALIALATGFLGVLLALLPWLAFVEEEVFRAGIEREDLRGQALWALRFGLAHLVMLVPVGAALAIGVAGFGYGRVYRAQALTTGEVPRAATEAFRPTRRSRRAAQGAAGREHLLEGASVATLQRDVEVRQAAGVLAAASVHTAFNATVILLVWLAIVLPALNR